MGVECILMLFEVGKGQNNVAFAALWQLGDPKAVIDLLIQTDRAAEATLLARTYAPRYVLYYCDKVFTNSSPSYVPKALQAWRTDLEAKGKSKAASLLADPSKPEETELFEEGWAEALEKEEALHGVNGY